MFTGLIFNAGEIVEIELMQTAEIDQLAGKNEGAKITIATDLAGGLSKGESIAVDGVCLTVTEATANTFSAQMMSVTLDRTNLGGLKQGSKVNLELPPRAADRLGGHIVQGHVDGVGKVLDVEDQGIARILQISLPLGLERYVVPQGSIAVNGVSLTVVDVVDNSFTVSLIPETLERTNLSLATVGSEVNLELDVFAKYVERLISLRERTTQ